MIRVLVEWSTDEEIDRAIEIRNAIKDILRTWDIYSGFDDINDPPKTFGMVLRDAPMTGYGIKLWKMIERGVHGTGKP